MRRRSLVYRLLLRAFPRGFRAEFGEDMADVFERQRRSANGWRGRAAVWLRAVADLAVAVPEQWQAARGTADPLARPTSRPGRVRERGALRHQLDVWPAEGRRTLRSLFRSPGWTAAVVTTLALGIGATAAIWTLVQGVLLRPLPYPDAHELARVRFTSQDEQGTKESSSASYPLFDALRVGASEFADVAAASPTRVPIEYASGAEVRPGAYVSWNLFRTLRVVPVAGRLFTPADEEPGAPDVALISHAVWSQRYASDPSIVGQTIRVYGRAHEVVGVLPQGFFYPESGADVWLPLSGVPRFATFTFLGVVARPAAGLAPQALAERLAALRVELDLSEGERRAYTAHPVGLRDSIVGDAGRVLLMFGGAVLLLLAIASVNVAGLVITRAARREREVAVRASLGAGRGRLSGERFLEAVLLSLLATALALPLAGLLVRSILAVAPESTPRLEEIRLSLATFAGAAAAASVVALGIGLTPAVRAARLQPGRRLHAATGTGDRGAVRLRSGMVVAQVALASLLLVVSGQFARNFVGQLRVDPGFDPDGSFAVEYRLPPGLRLGEEEKRAFYEGLVQALDARPEIEHVALLSSLPFRGLRDVRSDFEVEGEGLIEEESTSLSVASPDVHAALGNQIVEGRAMTERDLVGPPVVVVNETFARRYLGEVLGRRIRFGPEGDWLTVVGVSRDMRSRSFVEPPEPEVFVPYTAEAFPLSLSLVLASQAPPSVVYEAVRAAFQRYDSRAPIEWIGSLADRRWSSLQSPRFHATVLGAFALAAFLLATIGVYGVLSYAVASRARETGIRFALGASRSVVVGGTIRAGMALGVVGIAIGSGAAWAGGPVVGSLLEAADPRGLAVYGAAAASMLVATLLACWIPARRGAAVDPAITLREG